MNMTTYNTNNDSRRAVYFRDMRIYRMVSIPRHKVKRGEPTMMCSLDFRNIYEQKTFTKERNTYEYNLYGLKI